MRRASPATVLALATAAIAAAPASAQIATPAHWKWITDEPAQLVTGQDVPEDGFRFVAMPPGWHVTMGPGGVLYDPAYAADDRFAVEAEIFLFPGDSDEGYGIFLGGDRLEDPDRRYTAFLARRDGAAGVFRFHGSTAESIVAWTRHEAVTPHTGGTAKNTIRVEAERDTVAFVINGTPIARLARAGLDLDGRFGLRIGRGVNVHASNLDFTRRLAPTPAK